jgi:hypothetical protein
VNIAKVAKAIEPPLDVGSVMRRRSRRTWSVSNWPHARYIPKKADLVQTPPAFGRQFLFIPALRRDPPSKFETILPIKGRHTTWPSRRLNFKRAAKFSSQRWSRQSQTNPIASKRRLRSTGINSLRKRWTETQSPSLYLLSTWCRGGQQCPSRARNLESAANPRSQRNAALPGLDATARLSCADIKSNFTWFHRHEKIT